MSEVRAQPEPPPLEQAYDALKICTLCGQRLLDCLHRDFAAVQQSMKLMVEGGDLEGDPIDELGAAIDQAHVTMTKLAALANREQPLPIIKVLDVSIRHLPQRWSCAGMFTPTMRGRGSASVLIHVSDDIEEFTAEADFHGVPDSVRSLFAAARGVGCSYIMFDPDGPVLPGYEVFG